MRTEMLTLVFVCLAGLLPARTPAQSATGSIEITARITPTGARPEPVRQFTLYVISKSYADIVQEVEAKDVLPTRDEFISSLKVSDELKAWMKSHEVMDLTAPDLDKVVTPEEVMNIPEFFAAYQRSNGGGVTNGLPTPKFKPEDKEANPEKYAKQKQDYLAAMKKFIQTHPSTIGGMELELAGVNPNRAWNKLHVDHVKRLAQLGPDTAQTKYLVGKMDTDLDGRALLSGISPGGYWVSSLGMDAAAGDRRLRWDVPVKVEAGQSARLNLSNLNGQDANSTPH
jgi:hypothetical protein